MTAHSPYCQCRACIAEGIEAADPERAERRAEDAEQERADRAMAYADGRYQNYPEGWGDAPW